MLARNVRGYPDNDGRVKASGVREKLTRVRVVGFLKLVLYNDSSVVRAAGKNVELIAFNAFLGLLNCYWYSKEL